MNTSCRVLAVLAVLFLVSGCIAQGVEAEAIGSAASESVSMNSVSMNSVSMNSVSMNTLTTSSITENALGGPMLASLQDTTPVGVANRTVFHYIVTCALTPDQSVTYTWSDGTQSHTVTETGSLGLASSWATGPLELRAQHLVSACVIARVNYFGVPVQISVRGQARILRQTTDEAEFEAFPYVEGAFWGNLFSPTPTMYSCYDPANVAHSRNSKRECAAGYVDANGDVLPCGPIVLTGSCDDVCDHFNADGQYYVGCGEANAAITIGLQ